MRTHQSPEICRCDFVAHSRTPSALFAGGALLLTRLLAALLASVSPVFIYSYLK